MVSVTFYANLSKTLGIAVGFENPTSGYNHTQVDGAFITVVPGKF